MFEVQYCEMFVQSFNTSFPKNHAKKAQSPTVNLVVLPSRFTYLRSTATFLGPFSKMYKKKKSSSKLELDVVHVVSCGLFYVLISG